jgi:hypothetical protein
VHSVVGGQWIILPLLGEPVTPVFSYNNRHTSPAAEGLRQRLASLGRLEDCYQVPEPE